MSKSIVCGGALDVVPCNKTEETYIFSQGGAPWTSPLQKIKSVKKEGGDEVFRSIGGLLSKEVSVFEELWEYFVDVFIHPENIVLDNLGFSLETMVTVRNILIGLIIGIMLAGIGIVYTKRVLGAFVRKLLADEVLSPESAVRLAETGFVTNFGVRNALRRGSALRCLVRCREEEEHEAKMLEAELESEKKRAEDPSVRKFVPTRYSVDVDKDHFYIPEEKKYQAEIRFDKKGTTWGMLFFLALFCIVLFIVLMIAMPEILGVIDSFVGSFR